MSRPFKPCFKDLDPQAVTGCPVIVGPQLRHRERNTIVVAPRSGIAPKTFLFIIDSGGLDDPFHNSSFAADVMRHPVVTNRKTPYHPNLLPGRKEGPFSVGGHDLQDTHHTLRRLLSA